MTPLQALVLEALIAAAKAGKRCPTNEALGEMIGLGPSIASKIIMALERMGAITVVRNNNMRTVTISTSPLPPFKKAMPENLEARRRKYVERQQQNRKYKPEEDPAVVSCRRLLARQLLTGAHWINDPVKLAAAMREARIAA
jgi:hypothetical protein